MTIKTLWMAAAIAAVLTAGALPANAVVLKANVPFEFMVGEHRLPAGECIFVQERSFGVLRIGCRGAGAPLTVLYLPTIPREADSPGVLVFQQIGERYFLKEIQTRHVGARFSRSRAQRESLTRTPARATVLASVTR